MENSIKNTKVNSVILTWIAAGTAAATIGYGVYKSNKAGKEADKARRHLEADAAKDPIPKAHKEKLQRLRSREAMDMPGREAMEERAGASTSEGVTTFKEMGNQANFQDFIAQSIQNEQDQYISIGIEAAKYKLDSAKDLDAALGESAGFQEGQRERGRELLEADLAKATSEQQAGQQNIQSGVTTGATAIGSGVVGDGDAGGDSYRSYKESGGKGSRSEWKSYGKP